mmetsp:Transcript_53110/g.80542  ORF Transcript_53110/g.80542 Transcript_53110/m.80542 type:complete len:308 (+) Transcript_53110:693-1616(+)
MKITRQNNRIYCNFFECCQDFALFIGKSAVIVAIPRHIGQGHGTQGTEERRGVGTEKFFGHFLHDLGRIFIFDQLRHGIVVSFGSSSQSGTCRPDLPRLPGILGFLKGTCEHGNICSDHSEVFTVQNLVDIFRNSHQFGHDWTGFIVILRYISVISGKWKEGTPVVTVEGWILGAVTDAGIKSNNGGHVAPGNVLNNIPHCNDTHLSRLVANWQPFEIRLGGVVEANVDRSFVTVALGRSLVFICGVGWDFAHCLVILSSGAFRCSVSPWIVRSFVIVPGGNKRCTSTKILQSLICMIGCHSIPVIL